MSDDARDPGERALAVTGGLSTADVARLRRGELDARTVSALMEKTAGLAAPPAPPEGDLIPNGTGWRLGEGGPLKRIHPRLWKWALRSAALTGFGPTWAILLNVQHSFLASISLGVLPFALMYGSFSLLATMKLRALMRAPTRANLAEGQPGETVRLEGVVAPGPSVPTLFRGRPAVLFMSAAGAVQQSQGIDFDLDMAGGQRVRVSVRRALLLDRLTRTREPPACGPISVDLSPEPGGNRLTSNLLNDPSPLSYLFGEGRRYEASIGPGDRVEVCGVLHHEPDPDARAPFARQIPIRTVIRAGSKQPLLVRRLG